MKFAENADAVKINCLFTSLIIMFLHFVSATIDIKFELLDKKRYPFHDRLNFFELEGKSCARIYTLNIFCCGINMKVNHFILEFMIDVQ
jgi:hypothetical protein